MDCSPPLSAISILTDTIDTVQGERAGAGTKLVPATSSASDFSAIPVTSPFAGDDNDEAPEVALGEAGGEENAYEDGALAGREALTVELSRDASSGSNDRSTLEHAAGPTRCAICRSSRSGFDANSTVWTRVDSFREDEVRAAFGVRAAPGSKLCKTCRVAIFLMRNNPQQKRNFSQYVGMHANEPVLVAETQLASRSTGFESLDQHCRSGRFVKAKAAGAGNRAAKHKLESKGGKKKSYHGSIHGGGRTGFKAEEDLTGQPSIFAISSTGKPSVTDVSPSDVLECELCGRKGRRKSFMPRGRFCSIYCSRSFSSAFRVVKNFQVTRSGSKPLVMPATETAGIGNGAIRRPRGRPTKRAAKLHASQKAAQLLASQKAKSLQQKYKTSKAKKRYSKVSPAPQPQQQHQAHEQQPGTQEEVKSRSARSSQKWTPYYSKYSNDLYLSKTMRTPLLLACTGLLPRQRNVEGDLLVQPPPEVPDELRHSPVSSWSSEDVYSVLALHGMVQCGEVLREQEVDGASLAALHLDDLVLTLKMKVGPALKLNKLLRSLLLMTKHGI